MTEGERMVWAAAYARYFMDDYEKQQQYGKRWHRSIPSAIEWAWSAVREMREAKQKVIEGWGDDNDVTLMLKEMIGDV